MRRIVLILGVLIFLGAVGAAFWYLQKSQVTEDLVSGTIETDEAHVASRYGGRVLRTLAREGDSLKAGQPIVELDAAELKARSDQVQALIAELVAGPRKEELAAAKHEWEAQVAELDLANKDQKRITELFSQKTVPEADRDRAVARVNTLEKSVAAARSRYDLLRAGTRPERIAAARAQLEEIQTQIKEMTVASPTNCVLEVLHVKAGDVLTPNREVATLVLNDPLWVRVFVPETWLGYLKPGQKVRVRVDSFPGKQLSGEIEQIQRSAEFTPRNVQTVEERVKQVFGVKIRLPDEQGRLRPGMAADVDFPDVPADIRTKNKTNGR